MFDEAALRCDEEGCPITNATKAHFVLNQANLTDNEQAMSMKMANKGSVNTVTYEHMTGALLTLFGGKVKTGTVALVALPAGGLCRGPRGVRPAAETACLRVRLSDGTATRRGTSARIAISRPSTSASAGCRTVVQWTWAGPGWRSSTWLFWRVPRTPVG